MSNNRLLVRNRAQNLPRVPAADVFESDNALRIVLDIPGVGPDDVDITVEADELRLSTTGSRRYHRSFRLPDTVDTESIEATVRDGLLTIDLPKAERARPRKLTINP